MTENVKRLYLPLKAEYFEAIKSGAKKEEFRRCGRFWDRRIAGRKYDEIVLTNGYPKSSDASRRLVRPWLGYAVRQITHPHFGANVWVYAIKVN